MLLQQCSTLMAFNPIQDFRDTTQLLAKSPELKVAVASVLVFAVARGGVSAWRAGGTFRNKSGVAQLNSDAFRILAMCLALDIAGDATFFLPGGDVGDIIWAPASALAIKSLFGSDLLASLMFVKEALPLTDALPLATLAWLARYGFPGSAAARALTDDSVGDAADNGFWDPNMDDDYRRP